MQGMHVPTFGNFKGGCRRECNSFRITITILNFCCCCPQRYIILERPCFPIIRNTV